MRRKLPPIAAVILLFACVAARAYPQQPPATLTVGAAATIAGANADVTVDLATSSASVTGLQFDLQFSDSVAYVSAGAGAAADAAAKSASGSAIPGGARVILFGINSNAIGSGPVAIVRVAVAAGTAAGVIPIAITNIQITDASAQAVPSAGANGTLAVLSPNDASPPTPSNVSATNISTTGATIRWTTTEASSSQVEYGVSSQYGTLSTLDSRLVTVHLLRLTGLTPGATYHIRARSSDAEGNQGVSSDFSFQTAPPATDRPVITGVTVSRVGSHGATISWATDTFSDTQINYGRTPDCDSSTTLNASTVAMHAQSLSALQPDTIYYFRVLSRNEAGLAVSETHSFNTAAAGTGSLVFPRLVTSPGQINGAENPEYTGIAVVNLGTADALLTFTAYDKNGTEISGPDITNPVTRTLGGGHQLAVLDRNLFGGGLGEQNVIGWIGVDSDSDAVTGFTLIFDAALSMMDGSAVLPAPLTQFLLPEIDSQGFTDVHVANPNGTRANLRFQLLKSDGAVRTEVTRTLDPLGEVVEPLTQLFPGVDAEASDFVRVYADIGVIPFELMGKQNQYLRALNGIDLDSGTTTLYSPQYVAGGGYRTTLSIANLDAVDGMLTLRLVGDDGAQIGTTRTLSIGANAKVLITDQDFFASAGSGAAQGYVEIQSSGPRVAGSVVFGDPDSRTFATALPLSAQLEYSMVFSQVASDQTYFTGLALLNPNAEEALVTVELHKADGTLDTDAHVIIPGRQRISTLLPQLFPALAGTDRSSGYIRVASDMPLAGFSLFGTHDLTTLSAVPPQIVR